MGTLPSEASLRTICSGSGLPAHWLYWRPPPAAPASRLEETLETIYRVYGHLACHSQIPFDTTVRATLDSNIAMFKENPEEGPSCTVAGR